MIIKLDEWQKKVLETKGNLCLRSGRQVGKSYIISIKAGDFAVKNPNKNIMVIARVERQAQLLFEKILAHIYETNKGMIKKGKERPTKHKLSLTNGSNIYCLPAGESGYGIRGFTIDLLIGDEAAFIPEDVWTAVTPMLSMTGGDIWLLSTPHGREGYFYDCFKDENYTNFHVSTEDILNLETREDWQKENLRKKLEQEKKRMTKLQYTQEYLGEFIDELKQFFPTETIKKCLILPQTSLIEAGYLFSRPTAGDNFLGVDIARMGDDETALISICRIKRKILKQIDMEITRKTMLTETTRRILNADKRHNYKKIYIDDGGMGVGVFDSLLEEEQTRRKVVAINNASRSLDNEEKPQRKKLLKEDLYNNLLNLMEKGHIELFNNNEIMQSLKSIQYEYENGKLKIFGNDAHITEALIRATWCMKDKTLNIYVY